MTYAYPKYCPNVEVNVHKLKTIDNILFMSQLRAKGRFKGIEPVAKNRTWA